MKHNKKKESVGIIGSIPGGYDPTLDGGTVEDAQKRNIQEILATDVSMSNWGYGFAAHEDIFKRIVGKVLTVIESLGLPAKQETAAKNLIKHNVWQVVESDAVRMNSMLHSKIRVHEMIERRKECGSVGLGMYNIDPELDMNPHGNPPRS